MGVSPSFIRQQKILAAQRRAIRMIRTAKTDAKRLALADSNFAKGDVASASLMYARLAKRRPATPSTAKATERLREITDDAMQRVQVVDASVEGLIGVRSKDHVAKIDAAFARYDDFLRDFRHLPRFGVALRKHVRVQRNRPEFAVVLNEPDAKALWKAGQNYEQDGSPCCAYRSYEKAARLNPAPSAAKAEARLAELSKDKDLVASVDTCKEVERCLELLARAQRVMDVNQVRGRQMLMSVVRRAPAGSEVAKAAMAALK